MNKDKIKLSDAEMSALLHILDHFDREDDFVRQRQIREARQLKLYFESFQKAYYDYVAHDWRFPADENILEEDYYDKPVNVLRAFLESIIAALSITVPPVGCYPEDADNPLDISTAKAGDNIGRLIYNQIDAKLVWIRALFVLCTEGMVGYYHFFDEKEEYGIYTTTDTEDVTELHRTKTCPNCNYQMDDQVMPDTDESMDQVMGDGQSNPSMMGQMNQMNPSMPSTDYSEPPELCPGCGQIVQPQIDNSPAIVTNTIGQTTTPKSRPNVEAYGLLNIKVPAYARRQCEVPALTYSYESHYANFLEEYPNLAEDKQGGQKITGGNYSGVEPYERWARLSPQYQGEYPINAAICRKTWLRPAAFNVADTENCNKLKKRFPDGVCVTRVNEEVAKICPDKLDDRWTLSFNPLSDSIHYDPLGLLLVSIQDITNTIISLTLQTMEHGVPQTFFDPAFLDPVKYQQLKVRPGDMISTKTITGNRKVSDGFYEVKTSTLSQEVMPFFQTIQQLGQLVSGALPAIWGGPNPGGGDTASEYAMSRSQALQRLQNIWKICTSQWERMFTKLVPQFIDHMQDDEKLVQRKPDGTFINTFIRMADLQGRIGSVRIEANENLPLTWSQTKDVVMKLMENANPEVLAILGAPDNLGAIREAIGLIDFTVPGEDQRRVQYEEIGELLAGQPIQEPPDQEQILMAMSMGQPMPQPVDYPSVDIDPIMDKHDIHFSIVQTWAMSEQGRFAKTTNPAGYQNVLLHGKLHWDQIQQAMMPPPIQPPGPGAPPEKPNQNNLKAAPVMGESDVRTPQ